MTFTFIVEASVERESGLFAGRAEIEDALIEALEQLSPDLYSLGANGDSVYELTDISIVGAPAKHDAVWVLASEARHLL